MVDRVVLILSSFSRARSQLSLAELSDLTELPRSSVHRILQQLVSARWVEKVGSDYRLGLGIFEIGSLVSHHNRLVDLARPIMQQLSQGRVVVHLAILDGPDVVYLEKIGGAFAGRLPSRVGGRLPAHCTGVGKTILAQLPAGDAEAHIGTELVQRTSTSISDLTQLRIEFTRIRVAGYAIDDGEAVPGVSCVAAPIFENGRVCAALSICGPAGSVQATTHAEPVRRAATAISLRLSELRSTNSPTGRRDHRTA